MNKNKKSIQHWKLFFQLGVLVLILIAIPVATNLVGKNADNRNLATGCVEACPGGDNVLRSCTPPEDDGSAAESLCAWAERVEPCGGKNWCCPSAGAPWTDDMTKCPSFVPTGAAGQGPVLNYKITFNGVNPNSAQCAVDWPLHFFVLGAGESKIYTNVIPKTKTVVGEKLVFSGSLKLEGITKNNALAIFIKGPKHLRTKYCKNNQTEACTQAGGEIVVTNDATTSVVYDFSGYPLFPGDVVGNNSDVQDGWINGVDFSFVKSKSFDHQTIAEGGYLQGDLDGNCQVNSNDVNLLKISLQDKQELLY